MLLSKITLHHKYFPHFLNCTNGTKMPNTSHIFSNNYLSKQELETDRDKNVNQYGNSR